MSYKTLSYSAFTFLHNVTMLIDWLGFNGTFSTNSYSLSCLW